MIGLSGWLTSVRTWVRFPVPTWNLDMVKHMCNISNEKTRWEMKTDGSLGLLVHQLSLLGKVTGQWQMLSQAKLRRCQSKDTWSCPLTATWICTQHACMYHLPTHAHSARSDIPAEWFCWLSSQGLLTFSSDSTGALVDAPLFVALWWWTARQICRGAAVVEEGQGCRCSRPEVVAPSLTVSAVEEAKGQTKKQHSKSPLQGLFNLRENELIF